MNSKNSIVSEIKSGDDFSSKVYSKLLANSDNTYHKVRLTKISNYII